MQPLQQTLRRWWLQLTQAPTGVKVGVGVGATVLSCALCACVGTASLLAIGSVLPPVPTQVAQNATRSATETASSPTGTPAQTLTPTSSATPTATRTPTPIPVEPITGVTLGGIRASFDAKYPNVDSFSDDLLRIYRVSWSGYSLDLGVHLQAGTDGQTHASSVGVGPHANDTPDTWTYAVGQGFITPFLPADAVYQKDITYLGVVEHVYVSHNLALTFPASDFPAKDRAAGILAPPGTFEWDCYRSIESAPDYKSSCSMDLGAPLGPI